MRGNTSSTRSREPGSTRPTARTTHARPRGTRTRPSASTRETRPTVTALSTGSAAPEAARPRLPVPRRSPFHMSALATGVPTDTVHDQDSGTTMYVKLISHARSEDAATAHNLHAASAMPTCAAWHQTARTRLCFRVLATAICTFRVAWFAAAGAHACASETGARLSTAMCTSPVPSQDRAAARSPPHAATSASHTSAVSRAA